MSKRRKEPPFARNYHCRECGRRVAISIYFDGLCHNCRPASPEERRQRSPRRDPRQEIQEPTPAWVVVPR